MKDFEYERYDSCYGTVTGHCSAGSYLKLDNDEKAFAYKIANLPNDTKVLCTVKQMPKAGKYKQVTIDSVVEYGIVA